MLIAMHPPKAGKRWHCALLKPCFAGAQQIEIDDKNEQSDSQSPVAPLSWLTATQRHGKNRQHHSRQGNTNTPVQFRNQFRLRG